MWDRCVHLLGSLRSSKYPQAKGRVRVEELKKSKRGTRGTIEAEQEHLRGTTGDRRCTAEVPKMNNRGTTEVQQRPYSELEYIIPSI